MGHARQRWRACAGRDVTGQRPLWEPLTHTVEVVYRSTLSRRHLLWNWRRQMIAAGGHLDAIDANGRQLASQTCEDVQRMSQWLLLRCWKMQMQHDTNEEGVPRCPGATCATWRPCTRCASEGCPAGRAGAIIDGDACVRTQDMYREELSLYRNVHMCPSSPNSLVALTVPVTSLLLTLAASSSQLTGNTPPPRNPLFMCSFMSLKKKLHTLGIQRRQ